MSGGRAFTADPSGIYADDAADGYELWSFGYPNDGQDVATAMGIKPLTNAQLGLTEPGWKNKAPLWFYILKESELLGGKKLGPVGGRIVAEVILGLLGLDKTSYFNANPSFVPGPNYKMGDFILAADAIDPRIDRIEVLRHGQVRRAKLYFLRKRVGKAATTLRERRA